MSADAAAFDERRLQVVVDQAGSLRVQIALTAAIIAAIVWSAAPHALVIGWFLLVIVSREVRARSLARMQHDRSLPPARKLRRLVGWNALIGLANGSGALFMHWTDAALDPLLTMILVSWGAGAVSTSSTVLPAFVAYAGLVFLPTAAMWALDGSWTSGGVALLIVLFFGVQWRFAKNNFETFRQSFGIRQENEALAQSLASERSQLAQARDDAVRADLDKSRFLATASHDLRQPLQAIALNSGELSYLPLDPNARAIVTDLQASVAELRTMLDVLLDVSKLDAGAVIPAPRIVSIDLLVERVANGLRPSAAEGGLLLQVQCQAACAVRVDPDLMRRVLANLLDNAIKFTERGTVTVSTRLADDRVTVAVADTGVGIAPEHQEQVFEDLVQIGHPRRSQTQGHGLGLGIVRRLSRLLDLDLRVQSTPGVGSVFSVTLDALPVTALAAERPAHEASAHPQADAAFTTQTREASPVEPATAALAGGPDPAALAGRRVLVLEDDAMVRGALVGALHRLGCSVRAAGTLTEALQVIEGFAAHAAVIDWRLADGDDGLAALARLRAQQPRLAALLVTADSNPALQAAARAAGVSLLRKPVTIDGLREHLRATLG